MAKKKRQNTHFLKPWLRLVRKLMRSTAGKEGSDTEREEGKKREPGFFSELNFLSSFNFQ